MVKSDIEKVKVVLSGMKSVQKRKKDPGKNNRILQAHQSREKNEDNDLDEEELSEDRVDYEDNLTYHEDSLSVFRGEMTRKHETIPIWITTDSGSMTQLIQEDYAKKLKLKFKALPGDQWFHINGPGGGKDMVTEYVLLPISLIVKPAQEKVSYNDNSNDEENCTITLKFGVCSQLPVPILWGGNQMRRFQVVDHHNLKTLSMVINDQEYHLPSTSWMIALAQMKEYEAPRIKRLYNSYLPTVHQLTNMIQGERVTYNLASILYPNKDNVVRVGRNNARIDEGYNVVLCTNNEEVKQAFGDAITIIESMCHGESFIIVRNNTMHAIRLNPGIIQIVVRPSVCLPSILQPHEVKKIQFEETPEVNPFNTTTVANTIIPERVPGRHEDDGNPRSFLTWNMNGLSTRVYNKDLEEQFYHKIEIRKPDIIALQEVKLEGDPNDLTKIKLLSKDNGVWDAFMEPLRDDYDYRLALSASRYGGQAILIRKGLQLEAVATNFRTSNEHLVYRNGRYIRLTFPDLEVHSVYVPFNGTGEERKLHRRREWDSRLAEEMRASTHEASKNRIFLGDFNAVYDDKDISPHPQFWAAQGRQDVAPDDRGFGGTTTNERYRLRNMISTARLMDTFQSSVHPASAKWTFRGQGKFLGKGLKLDYIFTDETILLSGGVKESRILCSMKNREGFMGSDHAPLYCELHERWKEKQRDLEIFYLKLCEKTNPPSSMFKSTLAVQTLPKITTRVREEETLEENEIVVERPPEFPEELWDYVFPRQRPGVVERFKRFKDRKHLEECISKVIKDLDIHKSDDEWYEAKWIEDDEKVKVSQDKVLLAQAIANIDIYFFPDPKEITLAKGVVAEIRTTDEKPFKCRTRKLSVVQQAFLQAKTNIMLRMKQLEETTSDWCHGLVLVAYEDRINKFVKKHGEKAMELMFEPEYEEEVATFFRLCVDLRMLNAKTIADRFPLPRIDDLLESVPRGCGRYSISDIADAFFKCELKEEDRHKTAFKTHNRHLQFAVLPQGFINSPSIFCRLIARTFEGMDRKKFSAYIDDVLNHTEEFEEHVLVQQDLYDRLRENQLTLKMTKTHLNYKEVKFLGHILTKEGRLPDPEAVEAILEWKDPTTAKEVRSFLGATLYYREYIHRYADMAMPLYELIRKGVIVEREWDVQRHGKAIQEIKEALTRRPVLMAIEVT